MFQHFTLQFHFATSLRIWIHSFERGPSWYYEFKLWIDSGLPHLSPFKIPWHFHDKITVFPGNFFSFSICEKTTFNCYWWQFPHTPRIFERQKFNSNKNVLLCECKRHTDCSVSSTPSITWGGVPPPGRGIPPARSDGGDTRGGILPPWPGLTGGYPPTRSNGGTWGRVPPAWTWLENPPPPTWTWLGVLPPGCGQTDGQTRVKT